MKKFLLVLLSCLLIISFVACADDNGTDEQPPENSQSQADEAPSSEGEESESGSTGNGDNSGENNGGDESDDEFTPTPGDDGDNTDNWTKDYPIA